MPLLSMILLAIPMEPAALCAMTDFSGDIDRKTLDAVELDAVIDEHPNCMPAHMLRGMAGIEEDPADLTAVIRHFENASALAPDNSDVLVWLGQAHLMRAQEDMSLGDARTGKEYLEKAVEADPQDLDAKSVLAGFHRGAPWIAGGDIDDAYSLAADIRKHDLKRGLLEQARTLAADDKQDQALALARSALEQFPDFAPLAIEYAVLMHQEENYAEAHRVLFKATRNDDADMNALYQLGRTAALSGEFIDDGRTALERYLARGESGEPLPIEPAAALWRLGMIEQHAGNNAGARDAFTRALAINAKFREAADALQAMGD